MTTKTFEEFMSEINSTNIAEALKNAEKCLEAFEARDIIKQQQETIDRQLEEINRLLLRIDILAGEKSLCEIKARHCIAQYKAEAVKEFAERLHEYINGIIERHEMPMFPFSVAFVSGMETKIDNLVKETVGEG